MRKVGEGGFGKLKQAERAGAQWKKRDITVKCCRCDYEVKMCQTAVHKLGYNAGYKSNIGAGEWLCRECKKKDQDEVNKAIIDVARRKGLI